MSKTTSTRLGQILLDKGLVTAEQLDIAVKEQQKRRQLLDPFDANLGVNSSLGEILIELGFIDRLQLRRGLNWQLMVRKMAIVMSFCAPLMTANYAVAGSIRPSFTLDSGSSSSAPKVNPTFTKTSSSVSSVPATPTTNEEESAPVNLKPDVTPVSSSVASSSLRASSVPSSAKSSSKASSVVSSISSAKSSSKASSVASSKSSAASSKPAVDTIAPVMPEKITVVSALSDRVYLSWISATDNIGVSRYKIYRDQVQIDTVDGAENSYMDFNVAPGKTYLYGISAGDDSGNWSVVKSFFVQTASIPPASRVSSSTASVSTSSKPATFSSLSSLSASSIPKAVTSSSVSSAAVSTSSAKAVSSLAASSFSKAASIAASSSSSKVASSAVSSSSSKAISSAVSSSSSKAASSSSSSKAASSAAGADVANGVFKSWVVAGPVSFTWTAPDLRENGNDLNITEVGGYELRYRKVTDSAFAYVTIDDAWTTYYNFTWLDGTYIFQIAAFDKNGLYSTFVDLTPH